MNAAQNRAGVRGPPGVEPHDWEPSPRDVSLVQRATVFVHNYARFQPKRTLEVLAQVVP